MPESNIMHLKYRWIAEYYNGETLEEPEDGKSRIHPYDAENDFQPSAYRDIDHGKLVKFHLFGTDPEVESERWAVDLRDGHFEHNGIPFIVHPQFLDANTLYIPSNLELVFFRETRKEHDVTSTVREDGTTDDQVTAIRETVNRYFFGWKQNINGKAHTYTVGVA
jgi:hypothetical protein